MIGKKVQIDRGGPESRFGRLLDAKPDHLVLQTEEGILYYKTDHIKSITTDVQDYSDLELPNEWPPKYIDANDFENLLKLFNFRWIQINRGGPEKIQGFLCKSTSDYALLIAGKELIKVFTTHMRNISYANSNTDQNMKATNQKKEETSNQDKQKTNQQNKVEPNHRNKESAEAQHEDKQLNTPERQVNKEEKVVNDARDPSALEVQKLHSYTSFNSRTANKKQSTDDKKYAKRVRKMKKLINKQIKKLEKEQKRKAKKRKKQNKGSTGTTSPPWLSDQVKIG